MRIPCEVPDGSHRSLFAFATRHLQHCGRVSAWQDWRCDECWNDDPGANRWTSDRATGFAWTFTSWLCQIVMEQRDLPDAASTILYSAATWGVWRRGRGELGSWAITRRWGGGSRPSCAGQPMVAPHHRRSPSRIMHIDPSSAGRGADDDLPDPLINVRIASRGTQVYCSSLGTLSCPRQRPHNRPTSTS